MQGPKQAPGCLVLDSESVVKCLCSFVVFLVCSESSSLTFRFFTRCRRAKHISMLISVYDIDVISGGVACGFLWTVVGHVGVGIRGYGRKEEKLFKFERQ